MDLQLFCDRIVRFVILTHDQNAGRVHVDPMHDARTHHAVDPGKLLPAVMHQTIYQGSGIVSGCRMHHHALGLIHQNDVFVLIKDIQIHVFGRNFRLYCLRHLETDLISLRKLIIALYRFFVYFNSAVL